MSPRRAAVVIPAVKGLISGAVGGCLLALSFLLIGPYSSFLPLALFLFSLPCLLTAVVYLIAAFMLARDRVVWRMPGALLDAAASLAISGTLVSTFWGGWPPEIDGRLAVSIAFSAIWLGALIPVFLGAFRQPGSTKGLAGSNSKR